MPTYYMDYELGNDASSGSSWDSAWKTITNGATAARIAPGDVIRIAKSGSPTSIGNATWTDLSKTVSLTSGSLNPNIDRCEVAWTANPSGDTTVALTGVATDAKEGSYCMKFTVDAAPQTNTMQAYHATGLLDLSSYQKISFWIKNENAVVEGNWVVQLCEDTAGSSVVDTFSITGIPSTVRWLPLTLPKVGGGSCGSAIQSIAISSGSIAPTASKYIYLDNIIACTTNGLNLQSLISKNSAESGGDETWYGIQSINGTTILLDNDTNTRANTGKGYSGSTETVTTYKRETIKTALASSSMTPVQDVQDSGTNGNNIQFQGGYNTSTNEQDGETIFDGLNGNGYGIQLSTKSYITLNRLSVVRYNYGIYFNSSLNNTITTITAANNNASYGIYFGSSLNNTITTITAANNNTNYGIYFNVSSNNAITTITAANNNANAGIYFASLFNNTITTITAANNNTNCGIYFVRAANSTIGTLTTANNIMASFSTQYGGWNTILNATLGEATKLSAGTNYDDAQVRINDIGGYSNIWTDYGNIVSQDASAGGSGLEWKLSVTNVARASNYPLKLKLAEIALAPNAETTVSCYFKKSHATDIAGALVLPYPQYNGISASAISYCPNDTNRNQVNLQFTPSGSGVVFVEAWAWWLANTADETVIVDDITITQ